MGFYGNTTYEVIETFPKVKIDSKIVSPDKILEVIGEELIKVEMNDEQIVGIKHEEQQQATLQDNRQSIEIEYSEEAPNSYYVPKMGDYLIFGTPRIDKYGHILSGNEIKTGFKFPTLTWETW